MIASICVFGVPQWPHVRRSLGMLRLLLGAALLGAAAAASDSMCALGLHNCSAGAACVPVGVTAFDCVCARPTHVPAAALHGSRDPTGASCLDIELACAGWRPLALPAAASAGTSRGPRCIVDMVVACGSGTMVNDSAVEISCMRVFECLRTQ